MTLPLVARHRVGWLFVRLGSPLFGWIGMTDVGGGDGGGGFSKTFRLLDKRWLNLDPYFELFLLELLYTIPPHASPWVVSRLYIEQPTF